MPVRLGFQLKGSWELAYRSYRLGVINAVTANFFIS